jgi:hypothetical protein
MLLALGASRPLALGAQEAPPSYDIRRAADPIEVDGVLDEAAWSAAQEIPLRWEYLPGENVTPPVETTCHVTFDAVALYIACRALDPDPSEIRAHLAERDDRARLPQDDHVAFLIDSFNDERRGFEFRVNAAGVQWDAIHVKAEGFEDFSWDALWQSAVEITDDGWNVEVGIPFSSLRFSSADGVQTWGLMIERSYPRGVRYRMRSIPTDRSTTCLLCGANKITGFEGMEPGGTLETVPSITARRDDVRDPFPTGELSPVKETDFANLDPSFGLDVRWGVTPSTSVNGTVNPDFSHVEADEAQLAVNRRFALLFPEKRPFFLEGADYFLTPLRAVFTRTVVDPDAGLKVTGKEGAHTFGVFAARDAQTGLLFPSNQGSAETTLGLESNVGVGRYRYDLGPTSYVGGLVTARDAEEYYNLVGGLDAVYQLNSSNGLRLQYLRSATEYPDSVATAFGQTTGAFDGAAFTAAYNHTSRDWVLQAAYEDLTPDFRADLGFISRVDLRTARGSASRVFRGPAGGWFTRIALGGTYERMEDQEGNLSDEQKTLTLDYAGASQSTLTLSASRVDRLHSGVIYELDRGDVGFTIRPSGSLNVGASVRFGDFVDYRNDRETFGFAIRPQAQIDIGKSLALDLRHDFQFLSFEGDRVYTANLAQTRILYHLGVSTFVRAVVQYRKITRDPDLYLSPVDAETEGLFTQFTFSYRVTPQTWLYLGYQDRYDGTDAFDLTRRTRALFLKFGYALYP